MAIQIYLDAEHKLKNEEVGTQDALAMLQTALEHNKVFFKKKNGKSGSGYITQEDYNSLNLSTVSIPANFAGLEAEMVPTRLQEQLFRIYEV